MNKYKRRNIAPPTLTYEYLYQRYRKKLANTAESIFQWENLPETFDEDYLTEELIQNGKIGIIKTSDGLFTVRGDVGGGMNAYYKPKDFIYANPVLGSGCYEIGKDIAVIFTTSDDADPSTIGGGLSMLIESTAVLLADNELSIDVAQKNTRLMLVADADNEATCNSAENVLKAMYQGQPYKVVHKRMADSFNVNPLISVRPSECMRQLIETKQFIWAQFLQELGINSNFNLKRERLVSAEVDLNAQCLDTLVDNIEDTVNIGVDMVNSMYGTNIKFTVRRYGEEKAIEAVKAKEDVNKKLDEFNDDDTDTVATSQQDDDDKAVNKDE